MLELLEMEGKQCPHLSLSLTGPEGLGKYIFYLEAGSSSSALSFISSKFNAGLPCACLLGLRLECRGNKIKSGCLEAKGQRETPKSEYILTKGWGQQEGAKSSGCAVHGAGCAVHGAGCACARREGRKAGRYHA